MSLMPNGHQSGMFIKDSLSNVTNCLLDWDKELERGLMAEAGAVSLVEAWRHVDSGRRWMPDRAFLITLGCWTGYFDNHDREFLAQAHLAELCRRLEVDTCFFSCDDRTPGMEGSSHFCHYRSQGDGLPLKERQVMVTHDGGWKFSESGDPLPYEQLEKYRLRRKSDRLNGEILRAYGEALGIPFWDEAAYGQSVVLLSQGTAPAGDAATTFQKILNAAKEAGIGGSLKWLTRKDQPNNRQDLRGQKNGTGPID